jgi:hypothetical protein
MFVNYTVFTKSLTLSIALLNFKDLLGESPHEFLAFFYLDQFILFAAFLVKAGGLYKIFLDPTNEFLVIWLHPFR